MFKKLASSFYPTTPADLCIVDDLPPAVYVVKLDPYKQFFLEKTQEQFELPGKLYGKIPRYTHRIINTFNDRSGTTGILLEGEKGSGKSLLAKNVANELISEGTPVVVINEPYSGDEFNSFLLKIKGTVAILFDEFEKVYNRNEQESILTLLDGTFSSKRLFLLTVNDTYGVNIFMKNRPGRIYYSINFAGLDEDFITEFCNDNSVPANYITDIIKIAKTFDAFTFDMLKSLIEEMKRYNESPAEAIDLLNMKPANANNSRYKAISAVVNGETVKINTRHANEIYDPLSSEFSVPVYIKDDDNEEISWQTFSPDDLQNFHNDILTFGNGDCVVKIQRNANKRNNFVNMIS